MFMKLLALMEPSITSYYRTCFEDTPCDTFEISNLLFVECGSQDYSNGRVMHIVHNASISLEYRYPRDVYLGVS